MQRLRRADPHAFILNKNLVACCTYSSNSGYYEQDRGDQPRSSKRSWWVLGLSTAAAAAAAIPHRALNGSETLEPGALPPPACRAALPWKIMHAVEHASCSICTRE